VPRLLWCGRRLLPGGVGQLAGRLWQRLARLQQYPLLHGIEPFTASATLTSTSLTAAAFALAATTIAPATLAIAAAAIAVAATTNDLAGSLLHIVVQCMLPSGEL